MKKIMCIMSIILGFSSAAWAAQESYGTGLVKTVLECEAWRSMDGRLYLGSLAPKLVSKGDEYYVVTQVLAPRTVPQYNRMLPVNSNTTNSGGVIFYYQSEDGNINLKLIIDNRDEVISGYLTMGKAVSDCQLPR